MAIRILVNGASGKMGQETVKAVQQDPELALVAQAKSSDDLRHLIQNTHPEVVVDFTAPSAIYQTLSTLIELNVHPVIGTTGLTAKQITEFQQACAQKKLGGIIAPNFSLGAVLMMRFAKESARYFSYVEIIEYHHEKKKDSPSGTAIKTSEMIAEGRQHALHVPPSVETLPGARGASNHDIPIHSVRLPGVIARQDVIFGNHGETLTISDNSIHREAYMPGVRLACKKVMTLDHLVYGLENIL